MMMRDDMPVAAEIDWLGGARKKKRRASTKAHGNPEREQQQAVVAWIKRVIPGAMPQHVPNEAEAKSSNPMSRARFHQARRKSGINSGFPDLNVPLPGGRTVYIEMKVHNGVLSWDQQEMHRHLASIGHLVGVATCIDTARFLFHQWGIPLREPAGQPMRPAEYKLEKPSNKLVADAVPW